MFPLFLVCKLEITERKGSNDYLLETRQLSKAFKSQSILSDVSINMEGGGVYGLLGPNCAGK